MAVWKGVPLQSAIIVRHTPRDYAKKLGRKATGAMPCSSNARAVAYISRTGAFESKSDIDREPTPQDRELSAERDAAEERADKMMEGARSQADNILKNARMTAETVFDELETL